MSTRFVLFVALFLMSMSSVADSFYVGGKLGISMIDDTASAALVAGCEPFCFPDELSINGRSFDSNETEWGTLIGWNVTDWFALEIAYTDLGNTGEGQSFSFIGPVPIVLTELPPGAILGAVSAIPPIVPQSSNGAALDIEVWSISAKFNKSLFSNLSANYSIGGTRADFESRGSLTIPVLVGFNPTVTELVTIPFASPEKETGFIWGFGFAWDLNERYRVDLAYRKHQTRVIDIETVSASMIFLL